MDTLIQQLNTLQPHLPHVSINQKGIEKFTQDFDENELQHWHMISPFAVEHLNIHDRLHFILLLNTISFCYWGEPKWTVKYNGKLYDGAQGMMAALGQAVESGLPILNPHYWINISEYNLKNILHGDGQLLLLNQRAQLLRETGRVLINNFNANFLNVIKNAPRDEIELTKYFVTLFPSLIDVSFFRQTKIAFHKRAQLLVADIYHAFPHENFRPKQITNLTACADYKLPQVLRRHKILKYSPELTKQINDKKSIASHSDMEISIRANTILAVETIKAALQQRIPQITSNQINDYLWLQGQTKHKKDESYHLTITSAY